MRIPTLFILVSAVAESLGGPIDECQILQTTDSRTPCYILINQGTHNVPSFLYMINLPRSYPGTPCPVSQTLDPSLTCYLAPTTSDEPAFILNVPLPPNADEIDESPEGILKLREAKANPIFQSAGKAAFSSLKPRPLGPPSPQLTMAVFRPLTPSIHIVEPPSVKNTLPFYTLTHPTILPNIGESKYVFIQSKTPLHQIAAFRQQTQSLRGEYPYPSAEGSGSSSTFHGPYPPSQ